MSQTRDIHRIGGANVENLRLKPREATLDKPGISVLKAASPEEASRQMRAAFPKAKRLIASVVASTSEELIRAEGFDIMEAGTETFPNHCRIIHPDGVAGFNDENLVRLSRAFIERQGIRHE